jgi:hypothetical protein
MVQITSKAVSNCLLEEKGSSFLGRFSFFRLNIEFVGPEKINVK